MGSGSEDHTIHEWSKSTRREENGPLVYRRRMRTLDYLPVRHPNFTEDRHVAHSSNEKFLRGAIASLREPLDEDGRYRSRAKPDRLPRDGNTLVRQSFPTSSRIEVEPELGKVHARSNAQFFGVAEEPGPENYLIGKIVHLAANSKLPPREGESKLVGQSGRRSQLIQFLKRPSAENRCSPIDHLYKDRRNGHDLLPNQGELNDGSNLDIYLLEGLKRIETSPFRSKRKGNDNLVAPSEDPSVYRSVAINDISFSCKRRRVRGKDFRDGLIPAAANQSNLLRKRSPLSDIDKIAARFSPSLKNKTRKLSSVPLKETTLSCGGGLLSISAEALGRQLPNVPRVAVPEEPFGKANSSLDAVNVPVEGLGIPFSNVLAGIPVKAPGNQYSNLVQKSLSGNWSLVPVSSSVELLGILQCNQDSMRIPVETLGSPHSHTSTVPEGRVIGLGVQDNRRLSDVRTVIQFHGSGKDSTPAGGFKTRVGLELLRNNSTASICRSQTPCSRGLIGDVQVVPLKQVPAVRKTGVRRRRRMQLKRLFIEVHLPTMESKSQVVKASWSGSKQMQERRAEYSTKITDRALKGDGVSGTNLVTKTLFTSAKQAKEVAKSTPEGKCADLKLDSQRVESLAREQMGSGGTEGSNGFLRMTPRTRKLTDAMRNFLQQQNNLLRQWKEMELGKIHPMALIGRSCKLYWPLDSAWYPGTIHEYNPQTKKHRIDYEDDEKEWVLLAKERVKLHVSAEESKSLEMSFGEDFPVEQKGRLDADELGVLAAELEGCQDKLNHGDIVWAKVKGYPMWPAFVMDEEHASAANLEPTPRERTVPVQFFGSYDHSRINSKRLAPFAKGIVLKYHTKCKRTVFDQALQEIERYLKECKLPDPMAQLQEDAIFVANQHADAMTGNEQFNEDDQDLVKEKTRLMPKTVDNACNLPLEIGGLRVLKLGNIVRDSEQFHTDNNIWTEGYTAIRKFASTKDPKRMVEYKMEVLRNPIVPSVPLFRVTPEDDKMVEDSSPSRCWKRIFAKVRRAEVKADLSGIRQLGKTRPSMRPGSQMFGFGNRRVSKLIQALPNARVCSKFTAWIEQPVPKEGAEELAPAGYQPVAVCWKHLDRCNICYVDEEYADNQLLQCDKCRTMVHMYCYGELEPPDGDLWLCNLCRPEAPRRNLFCCLCPVTGGSMKTTTDGRWAHLTCAMWTPETCLLDVKTMEPIDGINSICKERWKLVCSVCKVPYGACIQCSKPNCRIAFHPLCARGAGLCMTVLEDKASGNPDADGGLQLLTYCKKHSFSMGGALGGAMKQQSHETTTIMQNYSAARDAIALLPQGNPSGCARSEAYNAASRRGHRQPEALAAALAKRYIVEDKPYFITGCQRYVPAWKLKPLEVSLWYQPSNLSKPSFRIGGDTTLHEDEGQNKKVPQSTSERYRQMRSKMHDRLTFGKSSIHGWGIFTKLSHNMGDMVIEYTGEILRPIIADIRERRSYDSLVGAGTYMFRIDDERVVDATHAGSIAHLINHSCEPNCYSRVITANGEDHIIIFAKRNIKELEELTYDYRFASKDELLTCYCGCTGCRGFVNSLDAEEDTARIVASRSELIKWVAL